MVEVPGDTSTGFSVGVGSVVYDVIDTGLDTDWFRVTLLSGHAYHVNLIGAGSSPLGDPFLSVFDEFGTLLFADDDDGDGLSAYGFLDVSSSGTYYIGVESSVGQPGSYALSVYEDDIPGDISTPAELAIGTKLTGYTDAGGSYDNDYYAVALVAGHHYVVTVEASLDLDSSYGLTNAFVELFDASGSFVDGQYNTLVYTPTVSGTYYVNAGGADASDGGSYVVGIAETTFTPAIPDHSPVDAVDWRDFAAPVTVRVFFAEAGAVVDVGEGDGAFTATGWDATELAAAHRAFSNFESVANIHFEYVSDIAFADFVMVESNAVAGMAATTLGRWDVGGGEVSYDGNVYVLDGAGMFNSAADSWTSDSLAQGGYGYSTLLHEIGHGMGLAHPHDDGGESDIMDGVTAEFHDLGDFNLNQGINTVMSYNDGWQTSQDGARIPSPSTYGFGWQGTLMALDMAALQRKYGANAATNAGDTIYELTGTNGPGTQYQAIWDTGGTDVIRYAGSAAVEINLNAATLDYSNDGGGQVSFVRGTAGGLTIANGVVIENATTGSGMDAIWGNAAANVIDGGANADLMDGRAGSDIYFADVAEDLIIEASNGGDDLVNYGGAAGTTYILGADIERLTLSNGLATRGVGNESANTLIGNAAANALSGAGNKDTMLGGGGRDTLAGGVGKDLLTGGVGRDRFVFDAKLKSANADIISDFKHNADRVALEDTIFKKIGSSLSSGEFYAKAGATKAHDSDDRIVYNSKTGKLYYDDDGNKTGGHDAILFATLSNKAVLDYGDFAIV